MGHQWSGSGCMGEGLNTVLQPTWRANVKACSTSASGVSSCSTTWPACCSWACSSACGTRSKSLAPGTTTIWFCAASSTLITATPVPAKPVCCTCWVSIWSVAIPASNCSAYASSPTHENSVTAAPWRAQLTAWLPPLPPGTWWSECPSMVSPARGMCGTRSTRSMFKLPSTTMRGAWLKIGAFTPHLHPGFASRASSRLCRCLA